MCDLCAKGFFDYDFNSADIDKISNFNEIASNFTYLCTSKFIKYNLTDTDHLLLKSKFYGKGKSGMYFCIFGSCQPLIISGFSSNPKFTHCHSRSNHYIALAPARSTNAVSCISLVLSSVIWVSFCGQWYMYVCNLGRKWKIFMQASIGILKLPSSCLHFCSLFNKIIGSRFTISSSPFENNSVSIYHCRSKVR